MTITITISIGKHWAPPAGVIGRADELVRNILVKGGMGVWRRQAEVAGLWKR